MEESNYVGDVAVIAALKPLLNNKHITIVWGAWCSDSRLQVPHFYKILAGAGFSKNDINLVSVDADKKAETGSIEHLKIEKVPTFIIFEGDKELGRIVEQPDETLEKDLLELLSS